eukprot:s1806_g10.t2
MAFTRDHGTCCIVLPLKLGVSLVAMLAFFDSIVCIVATLTGDIRFQPNGYNEHFYRVPVFIGVFGIFFGFSGLLGIYDDKPEWLRWLVYYLGVKQVALLATSIADYSTLWKCESWPTSSERFYHTYSYWRQLQTNPAYPIDFGAEKHGLEGRWDHFQVKDLCGTDRNTLVFLCFHSSETLVNMAIKVFRSHFMFVPKESEYGSAEKAKLRYGPDGQEMGDEPEAELPSPREAPSEAEAEVTAWRTEWASLKEAPICIQCPIQTIILLPLGGPGKRRLKMASVINQGDDNEAELMDSAAITAAYAEYKSKTGAFPSEDEELSIEQLSGLKALFEASRPPYCDFAVFGPYHHRIQKKIKMNGIKLSPSGEITTTEMFGPPDYQSWRECYLVFRTGCIMLNQISPAHLDNYEKHIRRLSERYNKASWALIYQADVRARLEHSERLLRQAKEDRNKAIALGNSHGLDLKRPWDFIWRQLVDDYSFWQREVIEPALQLAVRSTSLHQVVEQDAPVATGANSLTAVPSRPAFIENPLPKPSPKRPRVERMHKVGDDGFLTHNRRGTELCRGYQSGECTECDQRGFCKRNNRLRHQCAKCLSDFHGAKDCTLAAPKQPRANHGKGRGGKGGGGKRQ